jgi:hypothetical protein
MIAPEPPPTDSGQLEVFARVTDVCSHDSVPPDPGCAPQPLGGVAVIVGKGGAEVAHGVTGDDGFVIFALERGSYEVAGQPKEGYRITPPPQQVSVETGQTTNVVLSYNTGNQ